MKNFIAKLLLSISLSGVFSFTSHAADSIFCGDSRTVIMYQATHDNDLGHEIAVLDDENVYWTAKHGMGYDYFVKTCIPLIEENIEEGTKIYINMGVNDCLQSAYKGDKHELYKFDDYVETLQTKSKEWSDEGAKVYYVTLMPITTHYYDKYVLAWNYKITHDYDFPYMDIIDIYSDFDGEFTYLDDDVHLDYDCSRAMYKWVKYQGYVIDMSNHGKAFATDIINKLKDK